MIDLSPLMRGRGLKRVGQPAFPSSKPVAPYAGRGLNPTNSERTLALDCRPLCGGVD